MASDLILAGLFRHLLDHGFPLGIRDYQDALWALENGEGALQRERLLWLCRTLWARNDEEATWLDRLFREFPRPSAEELEPWLTQNPSGDPAKNTRTSPGPDLDAAPSAAETPEVVFQPSAQAGTALPRAVLPVEIEEPFVYTPRPLLSRRSLVICWRRFQRTQRVGPKVELDITATIHEKCRTGILRSPILSASRQNQAKVLVLADASASMSPFSAFFRVLDESLTDSRLLWSRILYFENVPSEVLYETEGFLRPVGLKTLLRDHAKMPLLIISDAGAARSHRNRKRVASTREFISLIAPTSNPIAWVNPMPRIRWKGTSAEQVAQIPQIPMLELSEEGMLDAIDALRGLRNAP